MGATAETHAADPKRLLSAKRFGDLADLSERTVQHLAKRGELASVRVGRKLVRIPSSELDRLLGEARRSGA